MPSQESAWIASLVSPTLAAAHTNAATHRPRGPHPRAQGCPFGPKRGGCSIGLRSGAGPRSLMPGHCLWPSRRGEAPAARSLRPTPTPCQAWRGSCGTADADARVREERAGGGRELGVRARGDPPRAAHPAGDLGPRRGVARGGALGPGEAPPSWRHTRTCTRTRTRTRTRIPLPLHYKVMMARVLEAYNEGHPSDMAISPSASTATLERLRDARRHAVAASEPSPAEVVAQRRTQPSGTAMERAQPPPTTNVLDLP